MEDDLQWKTTPEYLNFLLGNQTKIKYCLKWSKPPMEDDLKILNVKNLSNHWSDIPKILNLHLGDQTKLKNCMK